ncbi:phosphatidylglycerophosphate synthase [Klebsormidium nitens]|uniref:Phosphatidylglycerophosphate synthase n=1 Tax=Klebsormidium nitens TaxID=105231 RepID=A0A1Y1I977_KLENI|nr:phosphatidylglycerophosphate synthase [Klebsormidium nitens]|eukprot:GAQ87525.1 phosphatidylglycerophosphate synthase [Klebsormidium nitens]
MATTSQHPLRPLFLKAGGCRLAKAANWSSGKTSPAAYQLVHPVNTQHFPSFRPSPVPSPQLGVSVKGHRAHSCSVLFLTPGSSRSTGQHRLPSCTAEGIRDRNTASEPEPQSILNLPTCLTLARVLAVPLLAAAFYSSHSWATPLVRSSIFVAAALTDWLDGYLARKMNTTSEFGAFLDPVADKLMVAAALVLLCSRPATVITGPAWILTLPAIAIIGREITMSALREWAASQAGDVHKAVAVNALGKWKTASQMVALTILLGLSEELPSYVALLGVSLLYIAAALALLSLGIYFKGMWFAFSRCR